MLSRHQIIAYFMSINDNLMAGPRIQPKLFDIWMSFKTHKFVVFYRQINIYMNFVEIHSTRRH